ncbi:MAG TPA: hypothetical protein VFP14_06900 [Novosphingobium sp.]|nr:hypothetical protein [Novosphingobium sp.]
MARYPQMTDFPAHLARYHVMLSGSDPLLARNYTFQWVWSGNLGVDALMLLFGPWLGVEAAARVIAAGIPLLTAIGVFRLEWVLRGRIGAGSLLALPGVWSPALLLGFTNYTLSFALALLVCSLWIDRSRAGRAGWTFVPLGFVVFLAHQSGWGILGICVFAYEFSVRRNLRSAVLATWPLWGPFALIALQGGSTSHLGDYGAHPVFSKLDNWLRTLAGYYGGQDVLTTLLMGAGVIFAGVTGRLDPRVGWSASMLAVLTFVLPRHFGGGDFADYRLTTPALMLACLAIDLPLPGAGLLAVSLPFWIRIVTISTCWVQTSAQLGVALKALDLVPPGARVYGAVHRPSNGWQLPTWSHIVCYATVRRSAVTNSDFAIPGVHMLSLRDPRTPHDPAYLLPEAHGERPDLAAFAARYPSDYLWYVGEEPPARYPPGSSVVYRTATTLMIKLAAPPAGQ